MWPFKRENRAGPRNIENPGVPISSANIMEYLGWDTKPHTGLNVTHEMALTVPAVWAAINFLSGTMASMPLNVYRKTKDGREKAKSDPLTPLVLKAPNPEWTSYRWRKYIMTQTLLRGRSYTYIERSNNGKVKALWPLNPMSVTPFRKDFRTLYEYKETGRTIFYTSDEIIDVPLMLHADQITHIDPVASMRGSLSLSISLERYAERFFQGGGVPPLSMEGPFKSPGAISRASEDMTNAVKNARDSGAQVLPLPEGHTLNPIGFNPEQSQLVDARRAQLEDVARMYNLSPIFLMDLSNGTYSNTEQQDLHVVKHTITHWAQAIEQEMNLKLFRGVKNKFVEFDMSGLLRGDFKTLMEGHSKAIQNAIESPNEVRETFNLKPKPGGDDLFIQQNMISPSKLGQDQKGDTDGD